MKSTTNGISGQTAALLEMADDQWIGRTHRWMRMVILFEVLLAITAVVFFFIGDRHDVSFILALTGFMEALRMNRRTQLDLVLIVREQRRLEQITDRDSSVCSTPSPKSPDSLQS